MQTRNYVVTGASRGIGRAIAQKLLDLGHRVVGTFNTSVDEAQEFMAAYSNLEMIQVDFSDRSATLRLITQLEGRDLDGLVNNAGIIEFESFGEFDLKIWDDTFEVNVTAPLLLSTRLGSAMKKGSSIVNVASTDGFTGSFSSMSYAASKAALINLTKSLGNNLGLAGVRVNAVAPGWINTGMSTPESMEAGELTPLQRNGLPMEVAGAVAFLLSEDAAFVNGACLTVDGGYTNVDYIMMKEAKG